MARQNTPIWQDKSVLTTAHVYILKNGVWVDTGRHFTALPGESMPNYWLNQVAEDYVKAKNPSFGMLTLYSAYTETQPDAYQVFKTDYTGSTPYNEYGIYNDWSYEQHTDSGHCQNAPVNHHADARQILTYGRWGVSGDSIIVKELIRPDIKMQPDNITIGAEQYQTITIVVTSNTYFELILPEWLTASQTAFTSGTTVAYLYPQTNTSFDRRDFDILAKHESYWSTDYEYTSLAHVTQSGKVAYLTVTPDPLGIPYSSGSTYVTVYTNTDFTATTNSSDTWLTYSGKTEVGTNYYNVYFNVSANTGDDRQTHAYFEYVVNSSGGTQTRAFRVVQAHAPYISLSPTGKTVDAGSQGIRVQISSEVPWQLVSKPSWATAPTSGVSGVTLIFIDVDFNASVEPRSGSVVFSNGTRQASFDILQEIPSGIIKYSSNDGNVIVPTNTTGFGANYVTSVYYPEHDTGYIILADVPTSIGEGAFSYKGTLDYIEIPDSVTIIDKNAFIYCSNLSSVTIGTGVKTISDYAFYGCNALSSITLPSTIEQILGPSVFGNTAISSLTIPEGCNLGGHSLNGCPSLESLVLSDNVTFDGSCWGTAIYDCPVLSSLTIGRNVVCPNVNFNSAFYPSLKVLDVNSFMQKYALSDFETIEKIVIRCSADWIISGCSNTLSSITIAMSTGASLSTSNGMFRNFKKISHLAIENPSIRIGDYTFAGTSGTTVISLVNDYHIGQYAFSGSSLIGSVVISGSDYGGVMLGAFANCKNLTAVTLDNVDLYSNGGQFAKCTNLVNLDITNQNKIPSECFSGCTSLSSITLSENLTKLEYKCFAGCTALNTINYNNTMARWANVTKGTDWKQNVPATVVHCTDGDVAI